MNSLMDHFKEVLGEEKHNQILQEAEGKTYEELLHEIDELNYILEKQAAKKKEAEEYINRLLEKIVNDNLMCDLIAVLLTLKAILETDATDERA